MMSDKQIGLARKLVQESWWEWRAGMRLYSLCADGGHEYWGVVAEEDLGPGADPFGEAGGVAPTMACFPDLTDDATAGILLGMIGDRFMRLEAPGGSESEETWDEVTKPGVWTCWVSADGIISAVGSEGTCPGEAMAIALMEVKSGG